jgi:hypothetical protein
MLTVADETLRQLATEHGKEVSTHLYGQEINAETYAIAKAERQPGGRRGPARAGPSRRARSSGRFFGLARKRMPNKHAR